MSEGTDKLSGQTKPNASEVDLAEGAQRERAQKLMHDFHAYDVRALVPQELDADLTRDIARAFADHLGEGVVAVGRDMRVYSEDLAQAFIEGLIQQGREVLDIGMITTDMSYWAVGHYDLAGAAMITASHNPSKYDGIKFTQAGAEQLAPLTGLNEIRDNVINNIYKSVAEPGRKLEKNILSDWVEHTMHFIGGELKPFQIGIDPGNGMAAIAVPKLQELTPLEISGLYMELDGTFPNHSPNPSAPGALDDLQQLVTRHELDCGIAFDADGDRCFFIDEKGSIVTATELGSLLSATFLHENPHSTIVASLVVGDVIDDVVGGLDGKVVRSKVGRSNIQPVMREANAIFGFEASGHFFYRDNFFCDSALITVMMVLGIMSQSDKTLSELIKPFRKNAHIEEEALEVQDWKKLLSELKTRYRDEKLDELDGLTIRADGWWANVRPSNTEPLVRLNLEAKNKTTLAIVEKTLREEIKKITS